MKKLLLSVFIIGGTMSLNTSCNKVVDQIKKNINPFNYTAPEVTYTLPEPIPSGQEYISEEQTYDLNINQIIKDNVSDLNLSLDDFSKITINKVTLHIDNPDEENNWTNFESATVIANTDKGKAAGKPDLTATKEIPDTEAEKTSDKEITFADHNLKDYVNGDGTKVMYSIKAKARRDVNKELKIIATIQYSFKP